MFSNCSFCLQCRRFPALGQPLVQTYPVRSTEGCHMLSCVWFCFLRTEKLAYAYRAREKFRLSCPLDSVRRQLVLTHGNSLPYLETQQTQGENLSFEMRTVLPARNVLYRHRWLRLRQMQKGRKNKHWFVCAKSFLCKIMHNEFSTNLWTYDLYHVSGKHVAYISMGCISLGRLI